MRIAGFFIKWVCILAFLGAFVYFFCGQLWMAISLNGFLDEMKNLETVHLTLSNLTKTCQNAPASSQISQPIAVQLRFIDATHYQTEVLCTLIENTPVILRSGSLPMFVTKVPGTAGYYVDLTRPTKGTITLQSLAAKKELTVDTSSEHVGIETTSEAPATACLGWGYQCCSPDQEHGTGALQSSKVTDCANNCYAACAPLPYVQAFTTDPYPVSGNVVRMDTDSLVVTFSYTSALLGGKIDKVSIDYGDGANDSSTEAAGSFVHTYSCPGPCSNAAVIKATDTKGNSSVVNDASTIYIRKE